MYEVFLYFIVYNLRNRITEWKAACLGTNFIEKYYWGQKGKSIFFPLFIFQVKRDKLYDGHRKIKCNLDYISYIVFNVHTNDNGWKHRTAIHLLEIHARSLNNLKATILS